MEFNIDFAVYKQIFKDDENYDKFLDRISDLHKVKDSYEYPIQIIPKTKNYMEVTEIFVRVNSSGTRLRASDLALAQITSRWPGSLKNEFTPFRKEIPLLIPATSTVGLKLAGKIGDGVMLNALCSDVYTKNAIKILKTSVAEAGRDWSKFAVYKLVNCSVEDDHKKAVDRMKPELATRFKPIQFPFATRPLMTIGEPCIKEEDIPMFEEAWEKKGIDGLVEVLPDSYVESMTASGTPDEVLKRVQDFEDAGVQVCCLRPAAQDQADRLLDLFAHK